MECPACAGSEVRVLETRRTGEGYKATIRRRRQCRCGLRWTTGEAIIEFSGLTGAYVAMDKPSYLCEPEGFPGLAEGKSPNETLDLVSGGVGGGLPSVIGSDSDLGPISSSDPIFSLALTPISRSKNTELVRKSPSTPGPTYSQDFLVFWRSYPRRTGKGAAWTSWARHRPHLPDVLRALSWQAQTPDWTKDGGAFIPHPATWLNQRRWEDEPAEVARAAPRRPYAR